MIFNFIIKHHTRGMMRVCHYQDDIYVIDDRNVDSPIFFDIHNIDILFYESQLIKEEEFIPFTSCELVKFISTFDCQ